MKKLTLLFALLCASMMGWAADYCNTVITSEQGHNATVTMRLVSGTTYEFSITTVDNITSYNAGSNFYADKDGVGGYHISEHLSQNGNTLSVQFASSAKPRIYANDLFIVLEGTENQFKIPMDASWAACAGMSSDPIITPEPSASYCRYATGHLGNPTHGDLNGRILLTLRKLSDSSVRVKVEPNNNGVDYFDFVKVELNGVPQELGTVGGAALTDIEFDYTGLASLDFSVNVLWHNHNWADVNGRWTTNAIAVTEAELCEETTELSVGSEYCCYYGNETKTGSRYATLTWETNEDGDVVITIGDGPGETNTTFRGNGLGGDLNGFTVLSGAGFGTSEPASDYFNRVYGGAGSKTYILQKKGGVTLPSPAKIHFQGPAFEWKCTEEGNAYGWPTFEYTYGKICSQLDAPANVAIDGDNRITFDAVAGADSYKAYVYLAGVEKYSQTVASGDELAYTPLVTGDYVVNVIASGAGKVDSDPSAGYVWHLEVEPVVLGNSEYCEWPLPKHNNQDANLTWETGDDGAITITLSPLSGQTAVFRGGEGMKLSDFTVGATRTAASVYFNKSYTAGGTTVVLTLKDANIAPGLGEKIYFSGYIECTVQGQSTWPNPSLEYTYGTVCSGKAVSATSNNNTMGSAVAKVDDDEVTSVDEGTEVTFIATSANPALYRFVNWTKGGVVVSTSATYAMTITETTNLVANFDYVRDTYCHAEINSAQNKKLYLTLGSIGGGQYQIKIEGSEEAQLTGLNNANYTINWVTTTIEDGDKKMSGQDVPFNNARWAFDPSGYGSATAVFSISEGKTWEDIYVWNHAIFFSSPNGEIGYTGFPDRYHIDWEATCVDPEAPVFDKAEAEVLNESSVRLTLSATDNWGGLITYNINYKPTGAEGEGTNVQVVGASGAQITKDIEDLATNTEYTFTITASDGVNVSDAQTCKATPAGDVNAPTNVTISAVALTNTIVRLTLSADDEHAGDITYNIAYDNAGVASTSAAQGTSTTLDITGLTADTDYHFSVVATDAANNSSDAVNAAVRTFAANLALNKPATAGKVNDPATNSNNGNINDRWNTGQWPGIENCWWYVDLGKVYDIATIRIFWEGAYATNYAIRVSNDAENWTDMKTYTSGPSHVSQSEAEVYTSFDVNQGRYVGIWANAASLYNQWGISFWEFEVYGTPAVDGVAPVISSFEASGASTTSVLLRATADDNFKGDLTYTFYCNDAAQGEPVVKAAGEEATMTVNGLAMGTNYNFKVNVSDGTNNTMSDVVVGTPINDNQAPENVTVTSEATDYSITLTLSATDNLGGMIYYTVTCGETVKNAEALSGQQVNVLFDGLDYDTPYAFSVVAKDGSENAADAVAHNKSTLPATYPTSYAPAPAFAEASVRPVFSSAYNKDCNFPNWGGSAMVRETYGVKKATFDKAYLGIDGFGTIKLDADDELYLSVWTNEDIQFRVVPIIRNATNTGNLPERGAYTEMLTGGQWNVVRFKMSDFVLNEDAVAEPNENYDRIYQIKIDRAQNQTFWLDNIYFRRHGALNETDNAEFIVANNNEGQDISIPRTFPLTTEWYTLCLPFDLSDEQLTEAFGAGYTLATLANSVDHGSLISLNFDFVHSFEAGKAYLLRPGTAVTENPVFEGVVVKNVNPEDVAATSTLMNFQGTYNTILLDSENQRFVGPENYLYSPAEGGTNMKAFRCFFSIPQNSPLNGAPGRPARIVFGEQTATGMESVQGDDVQSAKVLMDGQLFILREGRTYNAQGILVK